MVLGGPCGWVIFKQSTNGRPEVSDETVRAAIGVDGDVGWQPIETAPRVEMILSCADGMVRLVMWEAGCWVQIGATIEKGIIYLTPDFISGSSLLIERQSGLETRS